MRRRDFITLLGGAADRGARPAGKDPHARHLCHRQPESLGMVLNLRHCLLLLAAILAVGTTSAQERNYPLRPITLVVPAPAGGPGDTIARLLSEPMRGSLGQPVVIENVGGA